ncbi:hypothetical protein [Limnoglobus roseus]|uniref:Uncharacterized protein n=1 Tax=Limnoglobus roseus TaxID=2598579 RepID=A0A5C1ABN2_9BACT|nr:hypothetical protein [Limnoglobus roseus]QEL15607.1 hypothetical protein PX52LOC_02540 [Limnoglobus roseus]
MLESHRETIEVGFNQALLARHAWERFHLRLAAAQTLEDALAVVREATPVGSPSYSFYVNLAEFLRTWEPPQHARPEELKAYAELVGRLVAARAITPEAGELITASLARGMEAARGRSE